MLSVIMYKAIFQNVILLSGIILSVILLNIILPSVTAPCNCIPPKYKLLKFYQFKTSQVSKISSLPSLSYFTRNAKSRKLDFFCSKWFFLKSA